jgi:hypothetical protein
MSLIIIKENKVNTFKPTEKMMKKHNKYTILMILVSINFFCHVSFYSSLIHTSFLSALYLKASWYAWKIIGGSVYLIRRFPPATKCFRAVLKIRYCWSGMSERRWCMNLYVFTQNVWCRINARSQRQGHVEAIAAIELHSMERHSVHALTSH